MVSRKARRRTQVKPNVRQCAAHCNFARSFAAEEAFVHAWALGRHWQQQCFKRQALPALGQQGLTEGSCADDQDAALLSSLPRGCAQAGQLPHQRVARAAEEHLTRATLQCRCLHCTRRALDHLLHTGAGRQPAASCSPAAAASSCAAHPRSHACSYYPARADRIDRVRLHAAGCTYNHT